MRRLLIFLLIISLNASGQNNDSVKINITNLGKPLNSAFSDFALVISADGSFMIFTSRRLVTEKEIQKKKESKENVYSSVYDTVKKNGQM